MSTKQRYTVIGIWQGDAADDAQVIAVVPGAHDAHAEGEMGGLAWAHVVLAEDTRSAAEAAKEQLLAALQEAQESESYCPQPAGNALR